MTTQQSTPKTIFLDALEISPAAERQAYVAAQCGGDEALRSKVEALLLHHQQLGKFLEPGPSNCGATVDQPPLSEGPSSQIGPYKLLEQIGEGGMGVVFMAEQTRPVQRRVALKIIKAGMDTRQVVARFEAERQALAMMDHPNIARVLDAGATDTGRPYFVMELVRGVPMTEFCNQNNLSIRERLELFVTVCQAVQHAHQKGIIHRDIKPTNVLVTLHDGRPVIKVIDFGVAKATGQKLTDKTLFTGFTQMIGTPLYMSPEQAEMSGLDVDTRSDIYSLGVLLYELLTGTTPLDKNRFAKAAYDEIRRLIREEEPQRPSQRLSTSDRLPSLATSRKTEPARLSRMMRGEVDWIVMKALEKDRTRRYETANGLARDIQRYLVDEMVEARPPSTGYRVRKFVRRNKGRVAATALVLVVLIGGIIGTTFGLIRADRALEAEAKQREVADKERAKVVAERDAKDLALAAETAARARTREALNTLTDDVITNLFAKQTTLGDDERAFLRKMLTFYKEFAAETGDTAEARSVAADGQFRVAQVWDLLNERGEALDGFREALQRWDGLVAEFPTTPEYRFEASRSRSALAAVLWGEGNREEAKAEYERAIAVQEKLTADQPAVTKYRQELSRSFGNRGLQLAELGNSAEAEKAYRRSIAIYEKLAADFPTEPRNRSSLAINYNRLGVLLCDLGRHAEAKAAYRQALALNEKLAAEFPSVPKYRREAARNHTGLGILLRSLGEQKQAEEAFQGGIEIQNKLAVDFPAIPDYRQDLAKSHYNLGALLIHLNRFPEADAETVQALLIQKKLIADFPAVPAYRKDFALTCDASAKLLRVKGAREQALMSYRLAVAILEQLTADFPAVPEYRSDLALTHANLVGLLEDLGKRTEAEAAFRQALAIQEKLVADYPSVPLYRQELARNYCNYGLLLLKREEPQDALDCFAKAISLLEANLAQDSRVAEDRMRLQDLHQKRAYALADLKRYSEAVKDWDRIIELDDGPNRSRYRLCRARALALAGNHSEAAAEAEAEAAKPTVVLSTLCDCATILSCCSSTCQDDSKRQQQYADRAMDILTKAVAAGFSNYSELKTANDFKPLRTRDDFQQLIANLEKNSSAKDQK